MGQYGGSIAGTHACGTLLDHTSTGAPPDVPAGLSPVGWHAWRTRSTLAAASAVHLAGFGLAAASEGLYARAADEGASGEIDLDARLATPLGAFFLWGFSDGCLNTWLYWLLGALHPEHARTPCSSSSTTTTTTSSSCSSSSQQRQSQPQRSGTARAPESTRGKLLSIGVYKCLNSAAHIVGYVLLDRTPGWVQLVSNVGLFVAALLPVSVECAAARRT